MGAGILLLTSLGAVADTQEERLINVGLRVFPSVIAASENLGNLPAGNTLEVHIIFQDNELYARQLAQRLQHLDNIKGHPLRTTIVSVRELRQNTYPPPFALFIAQRTGEALDTIIDYSLRHNVISFSPFEGDVEAGILAGIAVSDRILPYINGQTLSAMPYGMQPFFLKVAEIYVR
ncbi:MAG: hypothetical protein OQK94_06175 [Gammaproteobacteria bacterium]|nr:hypothetical protein [Gammaproteobacteria bacterium]MCW8958850.1 hypothetical protein [Gammaproteobacteria bacterium]MCW8971667.1 hypothetical protein [Gammaproteobacteria bacterium]MCW8993428.1 hypothetical protein [Gammaproteobacteria bacterium]